MPTTRYFAATDGTKTYFRASPTRIYRSMSTGKWPGWMFSMHDRGPYPVREITGKEFRALMRAKAQRDPKATAPRDSWVFNSDLPEGEPGLRRPAAERRPGPPRHAVPRSGQPPPCSEVIPRRARQRARHPSQESPHMMTSLDWWKALNAELAARNGTALVVVKSHTVDAAFEALGIKLAKGSGGPKARDHDAYHAGRAAGDRVNLSRPVGGQSQGRIAQ